MKKLLYPLLAAALLLPQPQLWRTAEAAPQTVSVAAERKDDDLRAARGEACRTAVDQVLEGFIPADDSVTAKRIRRRVLREYNKYVLHTVTGQNRHTPKYTAVEMAVTVDRDALAARVDGLYRAAKAGNGRACFLLRVTGALDKAAAEAALQQSCAAQYRALGLRAEGGELPEEAKTAQLTPMSPQQFDRFTHYMLDKLDEQWLDSQVALVGEVALSTAPDEAGVTGRARVRVQAVDADMHKVIAEQLQEYTATAATAAEAEQLVLRQAADDFAQTLGQRTLEALKAQDAAEAQATVAKTKKK